MRMSSENVSTTHSLTEIESAIQLIDVKKAELKKAFDDLQAKSLHLSSFSISWSDLDSHFTAIQNSVTQRFRLLDSRESAHHPVDAVPVSELIGCSIHPSKLGDSSAAKPLTRQDQVDSVIDSVANRPLNGEQPSSSKSLGFLFDGSATASSRIDSVVIRPELKELCERMDGQGLRKYINDHVKEREAIRVELPGALKSAPDPGAMVLDAMEGFYTEDSPNKGDKNPKFFGFRRSCIMLLEQLMKTDISFSEEVRERAKKLALEWKGRVRLEKDNSLEALAFLHLVSTYGLGAEVDKEELVGYFFNVARYREARMLCRSIGLGEKVQDLIQKLLDCGKHPLAVRFVVEFGLAKKFPPVPLLEDHLKETKRLAMQVCKEGKDSLKSQNEATAKEIVALKAVSKIIEQYKLETEHSQVCLQKRIEELEKQQVDRKRIEQLEKHQADRKRFEQLEKQQADRKHIEQLEKHQADRKHIEQLEKHQADRKRFEQLEKQQADQKRIEQLEKQQADRKRPAIDPAAQPQQQQMIQQAKQKKKKKKKKQEQGKQQQSVNKRPKTTTSVIPMVASLGVSGSSSAVPTFQQSHLQPAGLLPDHSATYLSSAPGPYGMAGSTPAVNPFVDPSATLYSLAGALMGFSVNPNPAASHLYSYDRLPTYGAYGLLPQYHPSYHPQ